MFNKGSKTEILAERVDTLIGPNTTFEGTIKAEGTVRINGNVTGEVIVTGNVIIGDSSTIKGNINAGNAYISGIVYGNISTSNQLHMTPSSKIFGDIIVKNVIIDEGAVFNGNCKAIINESTSTTTKASPDIYKKIDSYINTDTDVNNDNENDNIA